MHAASPSGDRHSRKAILLIACAPDTEKHTNDNALQQATHNQNFIHPAIHHAVVTVIVVHEATLLLVETTTAVACSVEVC